MTDCNKNVWHIPTKNDRGAWEKKEEKSGHEYRKFFF